MTTQTYLHSPALVLLTTGQFSGQLSQFRPCLDQEIEEIAGASGGQRDLIGES